jgi:hypothetical protein
MKSFTTGCGRYLGLFLLFAVLLARGWLVGGERVEYTAVNPPIQNTNIKREPVAWQRAGYTWRIYPKASYKIAARVLHRRAYDDWQADFVPLDLALGWGEIVDSRVDRWITWEQSDRWYFYQWSTRGPLSGDYIREHSANVHIIPATDTLAIALRQLEANDVIQLEGLLVDLEGEENGKTQLFRTSLSRTDSGEASCEILYVEKLLVDGKVYQ